MRVFHRYTLSAGNEETKAGNMTGYALRVARYVAERLRIQLLTRNAQLVPRNLWPKNPSPLKESTRHRPGAISGIL